MPASALFNTWFNYTITAYDEQTSEVITYYNGVVRSVANGGGVGGISGDLSLTNGSVTGAAYFTTGGNKTITATDTVDASIAGTSGGCNIITYVAGSAIFYASQWYTLPNTYNPNSNQWEMYGGGGGGGRGGNDLAGGGGGGGGYSRYDNWAVPGGTAVYIAVGTGGGRSDGTNGDAGGWSGALLDGVNWNLYATGGAGAGANVQADSPGGSGVTGNVINTTGGNGMSGYYSGWQVPGFGGGPGGGCAGPSGNGGTPYHPTSPGGTATTVGGAGGGGNGGQGGDAAVWDSSNVAGKAYGGGGGGGAYVVSGGGGGSPTAGNGAPGLVRITWQGA
jgi:hypothetical protein